MADSAMDKRQGFRSFFVKRDLQVQLISKIVLAAVITAILTTGILALVYYVKSGSGYFYFMSNNITENIVTQSILRTILPSLLIAEFVSILLGAAIGLFSSRKVAVPIFKIEQWLANILQGKFGSKIIFREKEEFRKITAQCNLVSDSLVNIFTHLEEQIQKAEREVEDPQAKERFARLRKMLPDLNPPTD